MPVDTYRVIAKYYDGAYAAKPDLVDLPFYLDLSAQAQGPVLEIACGTGRVLLPVARTGVEICGIDNSFPMLRILKAKLALESQEVRQRVSVREADMRSFRLEQPFPLVIIPFIPFRAMQHMFTVDDQVAALKTAASHLSSSGILAFDVFYPKFDLIWAKVGEEVAEMEWTLSSDPTKTVRRFFRKDAIDKVNQVFNFTFIFRTYRADSIVSEETENFQLCFYTYPHLRALFLLAGLEPIAEYGSFSKTPLDNNAEQMIFLLRRKSEA